MARSLRPLVPNLGELAVPVGRRSTPPSHQDVAAGDEPAPRAGHGVRARAACALTGQGRNPPDVRRPEARRARDAEIPMPTLPVDMLSVDLTGSGETALSAFLHHTFLANIAGIPALTVPCGFSTSRCRSGSSSTAGPSASRRSSASVTRTSLRRTGTCAARKSAASPPDVRTPRSV